jgi:DNA-binding NarL/FixJ family response regulator
MRVVLLSADLMIQSKVNGALSPAGVAVQTAMSVAKLLELETGGAVVVLDLATTSCDLAQLVTQLRGSSNPPAAILAFGPHVQVAQLQAAKAAGCDGVFHRGQFLANAAAIVSANISN